jgi:hypothetical protein
MRRIFFWVAILPTVFTLLIGSCTKYQVDIRTHAPEEPIRIEAKVEPIKIEAKVELHIYQHAVQDLSYITGAAPPKAPEPKPAAEPEPEKKTPPPAGSTQSGAGNVLLRLIGVGTAYAESSPDQEQLQKVLDSMKKRYPALSKYKADGSIGENHNGLVEGRPSTQMSDEKYARAVRAVVAAENADRTLLYKVRARIDGTTAQAQAVAYAKAWRENYAKRGEWIEVLVDKKWVWKQK